MRRRIIYRNETRTKKNNAKGHKGLKAFQMDLHYFFSPMELHLIINEKVEINWQMELIQNNNSQMDNVNGIPLLRKFTSGYATY
jgi:hypothetical protein